MTDDNNGELQRPRRHSWKAAAAVGLPILFLAAMVAWFGSDEPDAGASDSSQAAVASAQGQADERGQFAVQQATMGDFDSGRQVPSHSSQADFWYQARTGSDRFFSAREGAQLAFIEQRNAPSKADVAAALNKNVEQEIDLNQMSPGRWIAVRTSEHNLAAFTIESHAGISPGTLRLDYLLWKQ